MAETTQARNEGWSEKDEALSSDAAANPSGWAKHSEAKDNEPQDSNESSFGSKDLLAAIPQEWKDFASRNWNTGEELVRENPIRAALIGLGVGVTLGFLLKGPKRG